MLEHLLSTGSTGAIAVLAAGASVALGALLGIAPGVSTHALGPMHSFAILTAIAVVLGQLLPDAMGAVGFPALLVFGAAFFLPRVLEYLRRRMPGERAAPSAAGAEEAEHGHGPCTDLGLELSYGAFLLHRVGDGVGLALFSGPLHESHHHYDLIGAIAGHTVPVTALVVMAFQMRKGRRVAALRSVGIMVATLVGVVVPAMVSLEQLQAWEPWMTAAVGGLLLHVVTHGWAPSGPPTRFARIMDAAAVVTAVALVTFGSDGHDHGHGHHHGAQALGFRERLGEALIELGLETAPMLLLGLAIAALLQTQGTRLSVAWLSRGTNLARALRGAALGLPLPVCACGILPVAHSLHRRGAVAAVVVAFLLATPELGIETFVLSGRFLGWPFALVRLGAAFVLAVVAALLVARQVSEPQRSLEGESVMPGQPSSGNVVSEWLSHFEDLLYHIGAWTLVGLLAAAYMQAALTDGALSQLANSGLDVLIVTLMAVPSYVCASSATPLAAVLLAKGLSPGAVLTGLLLGPATNVATLGWLRKVYGVRATVHGVIGLVCACWLLAFAVNRFAPDLATPQLASAAHGHTAVAYLSAGLMVLLIVRAVWRTGLRNWLSSLGEVLVATDADGHAHHGHAHHGHSHHH